MLITLCYVYLWVRFQKCYTVVIRNTLRRLCGSKNTCSSFTFCALNPPGKSSLLKGQPTLQHSFNKPQNPPLPEETVFLKLGDKAIYITEPQACDDLSKWTLLLGSSLVCGPRIENISFIIEATSGQRVSSQSPHKPKKKVLKWSDYCLPLACSPGQPFRAVAQASVDNFSRLGVAFMEDRLQLDNGLVPFKIVSVLLRESALKDLFEKRQPENEKLSISLSLNSTKTEIILSQPSPCGWDEDKGDTQHIHRKGSLLLPPEVRRCLKERRGSEPLKGTQDLGSDSGRDEDRSLGNNHHMEAHGHHLHLSSCHECLELENSTIQSVKYASAENIPDLPNDYASELDSGDETLDELEDETQTLSGQFKKGNANGKPPNVLVYTGGCEERFVKVRSLLAECINSDGYVIYPLRPQQALSEPWLESTTLLVLAEEEPLTPQLQARFLCYLGQGGRVLGLSCTLCPAGLLLVAREARRGQICRLCFTREDTTELELSVLASGNAYVRDPQGGGEVELWGELKGQWDKDMVIVRMTHEGDGGEAVLCQVHLEIPPDNQDVTSQSFDKLKMSNARRYEVLTEILTSLGLSCELSQVPPPSPIYVLSTSQERKASFLKWLHTQLDKEGQVKSSKASLKVVPSAELQSGPQLPEGTLALVTDPPDELSMEQFNLQTYSQHLETSTLGRTLLYAEVTPTTMNLLDG